MSKYEDEMKARYSKVNKEKYEKGLIKLNEEKKKNSKKNKEQNNNNENNDTEDK